MKFKYDVLKSLHIAQIVLKMKVGQNSGNSMLELE